MARDAKIVQRGINVQSNDLAVPAGTMTDSKNIAFDRDGVGARRPGHQLLATGLPPDSLDAEADPLQLGVTRGVYDLFSGEIPFHLNQGSVFALDDANANGTDQWLAVPINMPHRIRLLGQISAPKIVGAGTVTMNIVSIGRALALCDPEHTGPFGWQVQTVANPVFFGTPGNDSSAATDATAVQDLKFSTAFDIVKTNDNRIYISDGTSIRSRANLLGGSTLAVFAGSITVSGTSDGTGTAARFTSASWMATDGTSVYVADGEAIRKVTSSAVVTTLAGSVTAAGDTNGTGTAARFRGISGLAFATVTILGIDTGILFVAESGGCRIRAVDVSSGLTFNFAGPLTPTPGYVDAVGTNARFNTPVGIERVGDNLYVGDTSNNRVRRIYWPGLAASVTTFAGALGSGTSGLIAGTLAAAILPSVTVRGQYTAPAAANFATGTYLTIECKAPNSGLDVGLIQVPASVTDLATDQFVYHRARCPDSLPTATTGPLKMDTFGIDSYRHQDVRAVDTIGGAVFTTCEQPRILDAYTRLGSTDPMPRMRSLGITAPEAPSCTTTAGSTFASNTSWAYRTVCGLKLTNGRIALGPPSERVIVTTGSAVAGSITAFPSPGLPYDGLPFVQIYRTRTTSGSTTDPGDVMFLAYESALTYGQGVVWTDIVPDDLLGAELYTNQYAFGAASASLPPPAYANEVASFGQACVLANFIPAASCRVKVLGTSALVSGTSTITLTTTAPGSGYPDACKTLTINFNSSATDPSIKRAQIASGGSAAQNAVQTARNIVRVINRCADAFMFRAFYDENDPGSFVVYSQFPGGSRTEEVTNPSGTVSLDQVSLTFATNASAAFATIALNAAQRDVNAIAPSDQGDVDSFPVINQRMCGPKNEAILRCLPLAETLLVVKDRTIFRSDTSYNFEIYETALSCSLPNSFARLNNQWIGLFTAGFRALTASQAVAIGRPIDRRVTALYAVGSYFGSDDFAAAGASDRQGIYLCAFNKQVFAFSAYGGGAWGAFEMPFAEQPSWIGAHADAFMPVVSDYPRGLFWQSDRRNNAQLASLGYGYLFYDASVPMTVAATVTASTSLQATLGSTTAPTGVAPSSYVGALVSSGTITAEILSGAGTGGDPFILSQAVTLSNGAALTLYMPIEMVAQYAPSLAPGINSQFGDIGVTLERAIAGSLTCTFYNRKDALNLTGAVIPYGQFGSSNGIERVNVMADVDDEVADAYAYYDFQRFATPAERSQDQVLAIALSNRQALAPLAIKAVVVELAEGGKVKQ